MRVRFPLTAPTKDEKEAVSGIALYVGAFTLTDYPALYCSEIRNYSPVPFFLQQWRDALLVKLITPGRGLTMHHPGVVNNTRRFLV